MTFHSRREVTLLDGRQILQLSDTERDGEAFTRPKHWHTYPILARQQPPPDQHDRQANAHSAGRHQ